MKSLMGLQQLHVLNIQMECLSICLLARYFYVPDVVYGHFFKIFECHFIIQYNTAVLE